MTNMSLPDQPAPDSVVAADTIGTTDRTRKRGVVAWALWDWGSAAFNAVVTTFVFSTYLASNLFVDPAIVAAAGDDEKNPALVAAKAANASLIGVALMIAGILIAVLAPYWVSAPTARAAASSGSESTPASSCSRWRRCSSSRVRRAT